jgi:hypothetical protein
VVLGAKGGRFSKLAVVATTGALFIAAAASADRGSIGRAAPVSSGFATIGGPKKLHPRSTLRIPLRCSVECDSTVITKLRTPSDEVGPDKATGHLLAGRTRKLIITFNNAATQDIKDHFDRSRLRVRLSATDSSDGDRARVVKVFRFYSP